MIHRPMLLALACSAMFALAPLRAEEQPKKELVRKVLALQQPGLEAMARGLVEQPAAQMMQAAARALQVQVAAERREEVARRIEADVKAYVDEALPLVRDRAIQAAPSTIGTALEEKLTEDELKQLVRWLESPVNRKYQQFGNEMQKSFLQKVVADSRPLIDPKIQALEQRVRASLGGPAAPKAAGSAAREASGPASGSGP